MKFGKHRDNDSCTVTWGTCDMRSNGEKLPHVCGEGAGPHMHICAVCMTRQV
jgi:hypothetical protein